MIVCIWWWNLPTQSHTHTTSSFLFLAKILDKFIFLNISINFYASHSIFHMGFCCFFLYFSSRGLISGQKIIFFFKFLKDWSFLGSLIYVVKKSRFLIPCTWFLDLFKKLNIYIYPILLLLHLAQHLLIPIRDHIFPRYVSMSKEIF